MSLRSRNIYLVADPESRTVVVDCQTGVDKFMKVEAFFSYFKDRESRGEKILKLKVSRQLVNAELLAQVCGRM